MPYYEIHHSYPLEARQKHALARSVTHLHTRAFTTPSFFVHVRFIPCDATDQSYYVAGEPRTSSTNYIHANVRVGDRSTADFDALAANLEGAWFDAVDGEVVMEGKDKGKRKGELDESDNYRQAKDLLMVVFYPLVAVRERGMTVGEAGGEAAFYRRYLPYMTKRAVGQGDGDFKAMLEELGAREDLKTMRGGGHGGVGGMVEKVGLGGGREKGMVGGERKE